VSFGTGWWAVARAPSSATLAAGCFSRSHENTLATGKALGLGTSSSSSGVLRYGMVGGGQGAFIGDVVTPNGVHHAACGSPKHDP
jgi:hypothetical protein